MEKVKKITSDFLKIPVEKLDEFYVVLDAMPASIYWKDTDGKYLGCNHYVVNMAGKKSRKEIIGKTDFELPWSSSAERLREIDFNIIKTEKTCEIEERYILANQKERIFLTTKSQLHNKRGNVVGVIGISFDITDYMRRDKRATEDTIKYAKFLQKNINILPAHIYWTDKDTKIIGANLTQAVNFGCKDVESCIGKDTYDFAKILGWGKEMADAMHQEHLEIIRTGVGKVTESTMVLADGLEHAYLSYKDPVIVNGEVTGLMGISVDITDRKRVEKLEFERKIAENTIKSAELLQKIINILPAHIYWTDKDTKIIGANLTQAVNFGCKDVESCIGKDIYDFAKILGWSKDVADKVNQEHREIIKSGIGKVLENTVKLADGSIYTYLSYKEPLIFGDEIAGLVGISVDITDRKQAEEELKTAKERAELASEIKSQFIQNMEHDLRTPAAGVYGLLNLIVNDVTEPKLKEMMQQTTKASKRLLDFLNDIITFDKYTSGQLPLTSHEFDLYDMFNGIVEMEMPTLHDKNVEFKLDITKNVPQHIISDKHRIFRIIINLIGNAIKFTKQGYVKIFVDIEKQIDPRHCLLKIVVEDTGIGIPADKIHRIYERFERCTSSNKGLYPGAGLGLSITKQFVEELQGEVKVTSKEGKGTTFTCIIPCRIPLTDITNYESIFNTLPPETKEDTKKSYAVAFTNELETELKSNTEIETEIKTAERTTEKTTLPHKEIKALLVEDDPMAQILANRILKNILHFDYDLAQTGAEALEMWSKNKYDFILMDLGLPDIKGDQVTKRIREKDKNTIIIALTAHDEDKVKKLCKKAGMQGFLTKPIDGDKILETLKDIQNAEAKVTEETPLVEPEIKVDEKQIFNIELCRKNARNNENVVKELIAMFIKKMPEYLTEFAGYYNDKNIKYLGLLAHKLKGAAITVGAPRLAAATENLQHITEVKKITLEDVTEFYEKVCAEILEVSKALEKLGY